MLSKTIQKTGITSSAAFVLSCLVLLTFGDTAYGKGPKTLQRVIVQGSDTVRVRIIDEDGGDHYYYDDDGGDHYYYDDDDYDYDYYDDFDFDFGNDYDLDYSGIVRFAMPAMPAMPALRILPTIDMDELMESVEFQEEAVRAYEDELRHHEDAILMQDDEMRMQSEEIRENILEGVRVGRVRGRERAQESAGARRVYRVQYENDHHEAQQAYQDAYKLILQGHWRRALETFREYLTKYPQSHYEDDARFWVCYSLEHSGVDDEEVFHAYNAFITDYPDGKSSWDDDAKDSLVRIGRRLAAVDRKNKAKYGPIVDAIIKDANAEVALAAIYSLQRSGGEHATEVILKTYDPTGDENYRKKVVMIIGRLEGPEVLNKLADIAVNDPSNEVRRAAIRSIGRSDEAEAADALMKLAKQSDDSAVRVDAVRSLGRMDDEKAVDLLLDIAMNDSHIRVRTEAVTALGRMNSEAAQDALAKLLQR